MNHDSKPLNIILGPLSERKSFGSQNLAKTADKFFLTVGEVLSLVVNASIELNSCVNNNQYVLMYAQSI